MVPVAPAPLNAANAPVLPMDATATDGWKSRNTPGRPRSVASAVPVNVSRLPGASCAPAVETAARARASAARAERGTNVRRICGRACEEGRVRGARAAPARQRGLRLRDPGNKPLRAAHGGEHRVMNARRRRAATFRFGRVAGARRPPRARRRPAYLVLIAAVLL
jgi:hypothetical protein